MPAFTPGSQGGTTDSRRLATIRATRSLALGVFAMAAIAWMVTPHGVWGGLLFGLPVALLAPRFRRLRVPLILSPGLALLGVQLGVAFFGPGPTGSRLLSSLVATAAVAPWLVILTLVVWMRARSSAR